MKVLSKMGFYPASQGMTPHTEQMRYFALEANDLRRTPSRESITMKVSHHKEVVDLDTISYIKAMDNYVQIFRYGLPPVVPQITMRLMERLLPQDMFVRVHRSYIVPLGKIEEVNNRKIRIKDCDTVIPLGRTYSKPFEEQYDAYLIEHKEYKRRK